MHLSLTKAAELLMQTCDGGGHQGICELCACLQGAPLQVHLQAAGDGSSALNCRHTCCAAAWHPPSLFTMNPCLQDLALGRLATAFGLLRLPRMPEIKQGGKGLEGFTPSPVDPDTGAGC